MALTINTNISSLVAQRDLSQSTNGMTKAMERLTTGYKINSGKDDAAGCSVATNMASQISAYDVAEANAAMGLTLLDTAEGVLDIINGYFQRIRDLTEQAANGTYGTASMRAIKTEVEQRLLEIDRLCDVINFNGIQLLDGTCIPATTKKGINLQVSNDASQANIINLKYTLFLSAKVTALMIDANTHTKSGEEWYVRTNEKETTNALKARILGEPIEGYDYSSYEPIKAENYAGKSIACITAMCDAIYTDDATAREFLYFIDDAIENVSNRSSLIGAYMNRVESAVDAIGVQKENIVSARSSIIDADVATESSNYIKYQILQQSSASLLSTANQQPSIALNLL